MTTQHAHPVDKVEIESLPLTEAFIPRKRLVQDRGELALIEDGMPIGHLAYVSILPGPGHFRGGHYHLHKVECFYVIRGMVRVDTVDLDTSQERAHIIRTGDIIRIHPRLAHRFQAVDEPSDLIEYYSGTYDAEDDHPFADFGSTNEIGVRGY